MCNLCVVQVHQGAFPSSSWLKALGFQESLWAQQAGPGKGSSFWCSPHLMDTSLSPVPGFTNQSIHRETAEHCHCVAQALQARDCSSASPLLHHWNKPTPGTHSGLWGACRHFRVCLPTNSLFIQAVEKPFLRVKCLYNPAAPGYPRDTWEATQTVVWLTPLECQATLERQTDHSKTICLQCVGLVCLIAKQDLKMKECISISRMQVRY